MRHHQVEALCYNSSAMPISVEEVRHIANLARLKLSREEEVRYAEQLSAVLDYAARLKQVNTSHISPTSSVLPFDAPLRDDNPRPSPARERMLSNAPDQEGGLFRVPPVLD
jgi:aspartyl-tRNA(Asn)/glutamyl-tRNA(Gln) amidotransferase subunit C